MALASSAQAISAKARAMYGRCLTRQDFQNLLGCHSVVEVASYLKTHTHYAAVLTDIDGAPRLSGSGASPQAVQRL